MMRTERSRMDLTMIGLYVFVCIMVEYALADIEIEMDSTPVEGGEMVLTCSYSWSAEDDWVSFRKSSIVWQHSYEDNQGLHKRTLETNYNYVIEIEKRQDLLVSWLTIYSLGQYTYGRYTCKNKKTNIMATVDLQILPDGDNNIVGFFGAVIVVVTLLLLVMTSVIVGICKFRKYTRSEMQRSSSQSSVRTQNSDVSERDPPPRYSLVVVTPEDTVGFDNSCVPPSGTGEQDGSAVQTPPPNYAQAILDLANKGLLLNIDSLRPLPPSYTDIVHLPHNSRQIV